MSSSNPVLGDRLFDTIQTTKNINNQMTVDGSIHKSLFLVAITIFSAAWVWSGFDQNLNPFSSENSLCLIYYGLIFTTLILCLVICFIPTAAPMLSPIYALHEGATIGIFSSYLEYQYPGIVAQGIGCTLATFTGMLLAYRTGLIKATERFTAVVVSATVGICLIYLVSYILELFGLEIPFIHESSPIGIAFSLFVTGIAALNLILDFDFIEKGSEAGLPKYMEWYAAFGLLVTLIWLYVEMIILLAKLRSSD